MWSFGAILAELLTVQGYGFDQGRRQRELFCMAQNEFLHLQCICKLLGRPSDEYIARIGFHGLTRFNFEKKPLSEYSFNGTLYFKDVDAQALSLLEQLLVFDPAGRLSAEAVLEHPYFNDSGTVLCLRQDVCPRGVLLGRHWLEAQHACDPNTMISWVHSCTVVDATLNFGTTLRLKSYNGMRSR
jgi:serine/threonine protein kinase